MQLLHHVIVIVWVILSQGMWGVVIRDQLLIVTHDRASFPPPDVDILHLFDHVLVVLDELL